MQATLVEQGFPAPRIVWFDDAARLLGRRFFVMERLEGHSMQGGNRFSDIARSGPRVVARLATVTASTQATLHRLDAASLVARLAELPAGVERWFARLDSGAAPALAGLGHGLDWLVAHRPVAAGRECICHGDLWGGNILVSGNRVTGVLDYTLATVAEPALDVGFTSMSLLLAPIDAPRPVQRVVARFAAVIRNRYVRAYVDETSADLSNLRYYEALRCATELVGVIEYRTAAAAGRTLDQPRPTWDAIADDMIDFFRLRTGVTLKLPTRAPGR